jgi:hypothetical protein
MTRRLSFAAFAVLCVAALPVPQALAKTVVATTTFKCQSGKSIGATFYASSVDLKRSDGCSLKVPQAMTAAGAR